MNDIHLNKFSVTFSIYIKKYLKFLMNKIKCKWMNDIHLNKFSVTFSIYIKNI